MPATPTPVDEAVAAINDAAPAYHKAERYDSDNILEKTLLATKLQQTLRERGIEFIPNYAGAVIDAVATRLHISSIQADDQSQTQLLTDTWDDNALGEELPDWMRLALRYGDGYLVAWPRVDPVTGKRADPLTVDITFHDPRDARMFYRGREATHAAYRWIIDPVKDKRRRCNLYYPDRVEKYVRSEKEGARWQPWTEDPAGDGSHIIEHDHGHIGWFHLRSRSPYGVPEHHRAYGPQNSITKLVIYQMVSTEFQGFPQRWALSNAPGESAHEDDPYADNFPVNGSDRERNKSRLEAGPGGMWWLSDVIGKVGQFPPGDPKAFLEPWRDHVRAMATVTATPLEILNATGQERSGAAIKLRHTPLDFKVEARQTRYGNTIKDLHEHVLRLHGHTEPQVILSWRDAHARTDLVETFELVEAKVRAGVPRRQALIEAGYTPEQVDEWNIDIETPAPA